ncbi:MAG TPA: CatB-related O-acetyltransferase [Arcobacter sp.]|nr:CatB-related O-acetyltransferase [Arcobacter sp.]
MIYLDREKLDKLNNLGFNLDGNARNVPEDLIFEVPCSLKRTQIREKVEVSAFSYVVSGFLCAVKIGRYCSIGENVQIGRQSHPIEWISTSPFLYREGNRVANFGRNFDLYLNDNNFVYLKSPVNIKKTIINNDVYIGHGAIINAGVCINNGAVIAAGSVVTKDVSAYSIVGGNPAQFIRWRFKEELIEKILETEWWDYTPKQLCGLSLHDPVEFINNFYFRRMEKISLKKIKLIDVYKKPF